MDLEQVEYENIQRVKRIDISRVEKIKISADMLQYKSQKKKIIRLLLEKNEIESFIKCLRRLKPVHLNHPDFPNSWLVNIEISGGENEEILLMQRRGDNRNLYVECHGHRWYGSAAKAISNDLHEWMRKNINFPILD